jgi:hypothetical protein
LLTPETGALNLKKISAGESFRSGKRKGRKREGASTVSLNHPLAVNFQGKQENYAETSVCIHGSGCALLCNAGFCR